MRIRAGVVLLADEKLVLMERVKANRTYYVVPGGGVYEGEYTHQAACREAKEELGVDVTLERLVAVVERVEHGAVAHLQLYYLVGGVNGLFGSGTGEEYGRSEAHGTYRPIWLQLAELENTLFTRVFWQRIWLGTVFLKACCTCTSRTTIQAEARARQTTVGSKVRFALPVTFRTVMLHHAPYWLPNGLNLFYRKTDDGFWRLERLHSRYLLCSRCERNTPD